MLVFLLASVSVSKALFHVCVSVLVVVVVGGWRVESCAHGVLEACIMFGEVASSVEY